MARQASHSADGASRSAVLTQLQQTGEPQTVEAVAEAVGLATTTVRFHLQQLIESGRVQTDHEQRRSAGRPRVLYRATPAEADDPAAAYRLLADLLAEVLHDAHDQAAALRAGRRWAQRLLHNRPVSRRSGRPRAEVADLFAASGFAPQVRSDGRIDLHRCPYAELALTRPDVVCTVHRGLIEGLLEGLGEEATVHVVPVLDGSGPCQIRITPAGSG